MQIIFNLCHFQDIFCNYLLEDRYLPHLIRPLDLIQQIATNSMHILSIQLDLLAWLCFLIRLPHVEAISTLQSRNCDCTCLFTIFTLFLFCLSFLLLFIYFFCSRLHKLCLSIKCRLRLSQTATANLWLCVQLPKSSLWYLAFISAISSCKYLRCPCRCPWHCCSTCSSWMPIDGILFLAAL